MAGLRSLPLGVPNRRALKIEHVVGLSIVSIRFFAICVNNFPLVPGQVLPIRSGYVEFGAGRKIVSIERIQCFQAKITAFRRGELDFLPILPWYKAAAGKGANARQSQILARAAILL